MRLSLWRLALSAQGCAGLCYASLAASLRQISMCLAPRTHACACACACVPLPALRRATSHPVHNGLVVPVQAPAPEPVKAPAGAAEAGAASSSSASAAAAPAGSRFSYDNLAAVSEGDRARMQLHAAAARAAAPRQTIALPRSLGARRAYMLEEHASAVAPWASSACLERCRLALTYAACILDLRLARAPCGLQEPSSSAPAMARGKDGHLTLNGGGDFFGGGGGSRPVRPTGSGGGALPAAAPGKGPEVDAKLKKFQNAKAISSRDFQQDSAQAEMEHQVGRVHACAGGASCHRDVAWRGRMPYVHLRLGSAPCSTSHWICVDTQFGRGGLCKLIMHPPTNPACPAWPGAARYDIHA